MIYATNSKTAEFQYHSKFGHFSLILNADGTVVDPADGKKVKATKGGDRQRIQSYEWHGWAMLGYWGVGGFLMFVAKRYFKTFWFVTDIFHNVVGLFIMGMTFKTTFKLIG